MASMTKEILDVLLRTRKWCFAEASLCKVPAFRITDSLDVGIIPADFVLNVHVIIGCWRLAFEGLRRIQVGGDGWGGFGINPKVDLLTSLEYLFGFKTGTKTTKKFSIDIDELVPKIRENAQGWLCGVVMP